MALQGLMRTAISYALVLCVSMKTNAFASFEFVISMRYHKHFSFDMFTPNITNSHMVFLWILNAPYEPCLQIQKLDDHG